ncbi:MAG: hypothetical protein AAF557_22085 [Pseudomonadota bacterium]
MRLTWVSVAILLLAMPANGAVKDARPLGVLLQSGAKVVAASGEYVWVELGQETYMCVVELNSRFRQALKLRNVRELYGNWPSALCFNAGSFE